MEDILNFEIARELLLEVEPSITEEGIEKIWGICDGNPFNAPILYQLLKIKEQL